MDEWRTHGTQNVGTYECDCADGIEAANQVGLSYQVADMTCKDFDECTNDAHNCGANTQCENKDYYTTGIKFECIIDVGYGPAEACEFGTDGLWNCPDLNECSNDDLNVCDNINDIFTGTKLSLVCKTK